MKLKISISRTEEGTIKYPIHTHNHWEIMYYTSGEGYLVTDGENIDFAFGTIIAVPPNTPHGSVSENGFCNISIGADFSHLLHFLQPVAINDNAYLEGKTLANLIYKNRFGSQNLLSALTEAFTQFFLENAKPKSHTTAAVLEIAKKIQQSFHLPDINVTDFLEQSGYSRDYIRDCFSKEIGCSPVTFLTQTRIEKARKLIEIYGHSISLGSIAEMCGYTDYVYFSKSFRKITGISPAEYQKQLNYSNVSAIL